MTEESVKRKFVYFSNGIGIVSLPASHCRNEGGNQAGSRLQIRTQTRTACTQTSHPARSPASNFRETELQGPAAHQASSCPVSLPLQSSHRYPRFGKRKTVFLSSKPREPRTGPLHRRSNIGAGRAHASTPSEAHRRPALSGKAPTAFTAENRRSAGPLLAPSSGCFSSTRKAYFSKS